MRQQRIVILGGGESGVGAALLAKKVGHQVFVSDSGAIKENYKLELEQNEIPYEEYKHTNKHIFEADEIIKSPGIPDTTALIKAINQKGISVISEIEFAARHTNAQIIAITGSNGKTTTTTLTYHLLHTAGLHVGIGGNVGHSFARLVATKQTKIYVLELSSFQLDGIRQFKPDVAILLNITPDHLDRYDYKLDNYIRSKFRIIKNQTDMDLFIYNADDENIKEFLKDKQIKPQQLPIAFPDKAEEELTIDDLFFELRNESLRAPHNQFNSSCAAQAARRMGVTADDIQKGFDSFKAIPHRLETVATVNGIRYINDSKATNVDSVYYALLAMNQPVVWIAGGTDKGNDYEQLMEFVEEKVKAIICLGADNKKLLESFGKLEKPMLETTSAEEAVLMASQFAKRGDTVLLSPACASFDLFKNYEDRGDQFKAAVHQLEKLKH